MDMVEHVRAAGRRRNGMPAVSAARFALLAAGALMVASLRDPIHRPLGRVGGLLVAALALFGYVLTSRPVVALVVAAAALAVIPVVFFLTLMAGECWSAPRSDRVWLGRSSTGWAGARVMVVDGRWMLSAVSSWPLGSGNGSVLMGRICEQADATDPPRPIRLTADVTRLVRWYARWGFQVERHWFGQAVMDRPARAARPPLRVDRSGSAR